MLEKLIFSDLLNVKPKEENAETQEKSVNFFCPICNILHKFCEKMSNGYATCRVFLLISLSIDNLIFNC